MSHPNLIHWFRLTEMNQARFSCNEFIFNFSNIQTAQRNIISIIIIDHLQKVIMLLVAMCVHIHLYIRNKSY